MLHSLYEFLEGTRLRFRIRYEGYNGGLRARLVTMQILNDIEGTDEWDMELI